MDKIAAGVIKFQKDEFPKRHELFKKLAKGQAPEALFIACSDSRVDPNLITQTEPGELFICRNAGNIVPPHTSHTGAMTASIEFAIGALNAPHIIICGHSDCGAMKGVLHPEMLKDLPHVNEWIDHARASSGILGVKNQTLSDTERLNLIIRENVILQMVHLRTHPVIEKKLNTGEVQIHGWVYDIEDGGVVAYDDTKNQFVPVAEKYKDAIIDATKKNAGHDH